MDRLAHWYKNEGVHLLGLDRNWNIVSTSSYGKYVFEERQLLFRFKDWTQLLEKV